MTIGEIVAIVSAAVAACALAFNVLKDKRGDTMASQSISDRLGYISDMVRETRDDVREVDKKLDNHANRITKIEAKLEEHDRRIGKLEE